MAIVVDPDNMDRDQAIFNTTNQKLSLYPVGAQVSVTASSSDATVSTGNTAFIDPNATFVGEVDVGDVIVLRNGADAAHHIVSAVVNASTLEVQTNDGFTSWTADGSALVYSIHEASGGSIADGVTEQCIYSFGKEEWRTDTYATVLSDDLIRHQFPFEGITSEQFEIGGGAAHTDWDWWNDYTRKKVRTGGWANKNTAASTLTEFSGIITLGAVDSDAQIYYQQVSAQNTPVDFTFLGGINESILTFTDGGADNRTFLKLFLRKKGKTFAGAQLSDIGVTQLQTIVNRFPLTHIADAAIVTPDAQILASAPFREAFVVASAADGSTTSAGTTFRSNGATFTSTVVPGDALRLNGGAQSGVFFTVSAVTNASTLEISLDAEISGGFASTEGTLSYDIFTPIRVATKTGGAASDLEDLKLEVGASAAVAIASSNTATFQTDNVVVGDVLQITSATSDHEGLYQVVSVVSENRLLVDSTDNPFTAVTGADFKVLVKGMYLQYKQEDITITAHGSVHFDKVNPTYASAPTIQRDTGSWTSDGVTEGTVIVFASTTSNNASFTVASVVTASTVRCVVTDATNMTDEVATGASTTAYDAFKRTINNVVYSFHWRLFANSASLANCYQFVQHQLRQPTDIDYGNASFRGDVTDLLLSFATPTGTTADMIIDDIDADDTNNATYVDATGTSRTFPFVSSFTITFNENLQNDASAKYRMFFTNDDAGDNTGRDYGTSGAITVQDENSVDIAGNVGAASQVQGTFDFDGNVQRGAASAGENAPVTIVAIGLDTAQFVITTGTITRAKGLTFALSAALERNYSNP